MAWTDYFARFRRVSSPDVFDSMLREGLQDEDPVVLPPLRDYRMPTTGQRISSVHRDYYVLVYDTAYPSLIWNQSKVGLLTVDGNDELAPDETLNLRQPSIELRMSAPIPPQSAMADIYMASTPVVSQAVVSLFDQYRIPGIEFFPARISSGNGPIDLPYYAMHIEQEIACLDEEKSNFQAEDDGSIVVLEHIVLDADALEAIELEQRLVFKLEESGREYLFHHQLVDLLNQAQFKGARFVPVQEWRVSATY